MSRIRRAHEIALRKHKPKKTGPNYNPILGREMTDLETRHQKIVVALFLILGRACNMLNSKQRQGVTCMESEIAEAWIQKKSPIRITSKSVPVMMLQITEFEQWGGEREYSVVFGELDLGVVAKGFASVPMPKADPTDMVKDEKTRVFTLE